MCPAELQLNRASSSDAEAPFLGLGLCVSDGAEFMINGKILILSQFPFSGWRCPPACLMWGLQSFFKS